MRGGRALAPSVGIALACLVAATQAAAATTTTPATRQTLTGTPITTSLVTTTSTTTTASLAPAAVSSARATAIASRLPLVRSLERTHPHAFSQVSRPVAGQWQVAFYSGNQEFVQVLVSSSDGHVIGQYTGFKIAWTMARGIPGAFGEHVDALYVWLPLCLLFLGPFLDWRRPLRVRNADLLVLTSLSISLALFNHADIYQSVPLSYPPLIYLLARLVWITLHRRAAAPRPLALNVSVGWLAIGLVLLIGARIGLNLADSSVIDVGYANVVGAQKVIHGQALYGHFPSDIAQGDTYGPVAYEAYTPFVALWGFSGTWDDLPAAHAAAIFFDLIAIGLLLALGWRIRGPATGVVLAYAWAAFPFTAFALESNSNDALVASLVLATLLVAGSPPARGALAALAALAKFAPLALIPLFATHRLRERGARGVAGFAAALLIVAAAVAVPALTHNSLTTIYDRTIAYQADRSAPFSVWGLYGGLHAEQTLVQVFAILLAGALAVLPRRDDAIGLAAAAAAILIAVQLGVTYWFYLYIPWFAGPALIAILADAPLELHRRRASGAGGGGYLPLGPTRTGA
jgi:hypothetical protein